MLNIAINNEIDASDQSISQIEAGLLDKFEGATIRQEVEELLRLHIRLHESVARCAGLVMNATPIDLTEAGAWDRVYDRLAQQFEKAAATARRLQAMGLEPSNHAEFNDSHFHLREVRAFSLERLANAQNQAGSGKTRTHGEVRDALRARLGR